MSVNTWGAQGATESKTIIRDNELLTGLIDKKHIGAQANGLTHCLNELIGGEAAGCFITSFGRLCTYLLMRKGFTCSLEDMVLKSKADNNRLQVEKDMNAKFEKIATEFLEVQGTISFDQLKQALKYKFNTEKDSFDKFDGLM